MGHLASKGVVHLVKKSVYSVQKMDSDENTQGTATGEGEKNNDMLRATEI